jgi:hypothetical protein
MTRHQTRPEIAVDLALGANPKIDCAMIMPRTDQLGYPVKGLPPKVSSFFDIFREIQVELASRHDIREFFTPFVSKRLKR